MIRLAFQQVLCIIQKYIQREQQRLYLFLVEENKLLVKLRNNYTSLNYENNCHASKVSNIIFLIKLISKF